MSTITESHDSVSHNKRSKYKVDKRVEGCNYCMISNKYFYIRVRDVMVKKNKTCEKKCCCVAGLVIKITGINILSVACITSIPVGLGGGGTKAKKRKRGWGRKGRKHLSVALKHQWPQNWTCY